MDISAVSPVTAYSAVTRQENRRNAAQSEGSGLLASLPPLNVSKESLAQDTADFSGKVRSLFRDNGIRTPPNPVLGIDDQGAVRVSGDHPDKAGIEALFQANPELRNDLARISANATLMRAAEGYEEYARKYAQAQGNPSAQAALTYAEIARNKAEFHLAITPQGAESFFVGLQGIQA